MFGRLSPQARSLQLLGAYQRRLSSTSRPSSSPRPGPLRILFCGADEFSIASLRALEHARRADRQLIDSIAVVHRPGKRTGRGLKVIREVPIKEVATTELSLATHEIDTFTGWTPPTPFDLVIAVSFGLLVPPRILGAAQYGGLNVHPSLLPDLRGPAPIHHTLLKRRPRTGVTVQTLHPKHFDQGLILAQTPPPGLDVPEEATPADLIQHLGILGGQMLVDVLKSGSFIAPLEEAAWYESSGGPVEHAEKITPAHRYVDFATDTAQDIATRHRVLGNLWTNMRNGERVIINEIQPLGVERETGGGTGLFIEDGTNGVFACAADGRLMEIVSTTVAGGKKKTGNAHVRRILSEGVPISSRL